MGARMCMYGQEETAALYQFATFMFPTGGAMRTRHAEILALAAVGVGQCAAPVRPLFAGAVPGPARYPGGH